MQSPGDLMKTLLSIKNQFPNETVVIDIYEDRFHYTGEALAYRDVFAMFSGGTERELDIEIHLKSSVSHFFLIAVSPLPKEKVFIAERLFVTWNEFNNYVYGSASEWEDMDIYYEIVEASVNSILTKAYDMDLEDVKNLVDEGSWWYGDELTSVIGYKALSESVHSSAIQNKLELKPEPILVFNTDFYDCVAAKFIAELDMMNAAGVKDVMVIINTPGGSVFSLNAMLSARERFNGNITIIAVGTAASAGGTFLASAQLGNRVMTSNSVLMIHQFRGFAKRKNKDQNHELGAAMTDEIAKHAKVPRSKIEELLLRDTYLTPEQALEYGLIDTILG